VPPTAVGGESKNGWPGRTIVQSVAPVVASSAVNRPSKVIAKMRPPS